MSPIPIKLHQQLATDPEYRVCSRAGSACKGRMTWEHAILYAGKQVQEKWAILPLCFYHHLGAGLDKRWNINYAMSRAKKQDRLNYPRLKWHA